MMYIIKPTAKYRRQRRLMAKQKKDLSKLDTAIDLLAAGNPMPQEYKDHALHGDYEGSRECHIAPDWLLIYEIANGELLLYLQETGSHSELFKK
jgi:mRNA interferase YafQ